MAFDWEFRLVSTNATTITGRGRLELRPGPGSSWGTICGFTSNSNSPSFYSFSNFDAIRACHSLGFSYVEEAAVFQAPNGTGPIYFGDMTCPAHTRLLEECMATYRPSCQHSQDIGIDCLCDFNNCTNTGQAHSMGTVTTAPDVQASTNTTWEFRLASATQSSTVIFGRLEARPNSSAAWGVVCDDAFSAADAAAACRSLGYEFANPDTVSVIPAFGGTNPLFWMDDVKCQPNDIYLHQCTWTNYSSMNCAPDEAVGVRCPTVASMVANTSWQYRLIGAGGYGRFELRPMTNAEWGTVCNNWVTSQEATVACRSLGYNQGSIAKPPKGAHTLTSHVPIYMDDLVGPTGNELTLDACDFTIYATCSHVNDLFLNCSSSGATVLPVTTTSPSSIGPSSNSAQNEETVEKEKKANSLISVGAILIGVAVIITLLNFAFLWRKGNCGGEAQRITNDHQYQAGLVNSSYSPPEELPPNVVYQRTNTLQSATNVAEGHSDFEARPDTSLYN